MCIPHVRMRYIVLIYFKVYFLHAEINIDITTNIELVYVKVYFLYAEAHLVPPFRLFFERSCPHTPSKIFMLLLKLRIRLSAF